MVFPIVGGNQSSGDIITNSLRFDGSSSYLYHTHQSGNKDTFTFSSWIKFGDLDNDTSADVLFSVTNTGYVIIRFEDKQLDYLDYDGSDVGTVSTNRLFRDVSAWYHIVVAIDMTQSTDSNRVKLYVNGSQESSFATATYQPQNQDTVVNTAAEHRIGRESGNYFSGYMADVNFIDGTAYAASDFGETNDNGVWIPKKPAVTYGTNGYRLEFKQTGTSANASGIGADTSGQGNHHSVSGLAATDITTDTPQNNFCTLNPLADANLAGATFSEGNCKVDVGKSGVESGVISTFLLSSGKWYWESKMIDRQTTNTFMVGVVASQVTGTGTIANYTDNKFYYANNGDIHDTDASGDNGTDYGDSYDEGDIVGVALDLDNNKIYFSKNGTFQASGDPANNSNGHSITAPASTNLGGYIAGFGGFQTYSHVIEINFGNAPYAISSGNSDANGYGNFEYSVPSGFFACCTKNLVEYG